MPTAAKLVAAVAFAAVAFFAAEIFKPAMPPDTQFGYFSYICASISALCGWFVMGGLVGRGSSAAIGSGIRTITTAVFLLLLLFSGREMILRAMKLRYHGPMDAIQAMFGLVVDFGRMMLTPEELGTLLIGGALAGLLADWSARRWR